MGCKPETEEALHGCSENAHVHYPGSGDAVGHCSLVPVALVGRGGDAFPLGLANWFAPSTSRNRALFLVCGGVHLQRTCNASAYRCAKIPGQGGTLSMGAQSDVSCGFFGGDRRSHSLSLTAAGRLWVAGRIGGASVCRLLRGTTASSSVWGEL